MSDDFQSFFYWFENLSPLEDNITIGGIKQPKIILSIGIVGKCPDWINKEFIKDICLQNPSCQKKIEEFTQSNNEMKNNTTINITQSIFGSVTGEGTIDTAIINQYNYSAEEKQTFHKHQ